MFIGVIPAGFDPKITRIITMARHFGTIMLCAAGATATAAGGAVVGTVTRHTRLVNAHIIYAGLVNCPVRAIVTGEAGCGTCPIWYIAFLGSLTLSTEPFGGITTANRITSAICFQIVCITTEIGTGQELTSVCRRCAKDSG